MAQAESIADNIAFQVNEAYRRLVAARLGIEDAPPGGRAGDRELPPRPAPGPRGERHADGDHRRPGLADPRPAELPECPVCVLDRDRQAGICHGRQPDAGDLVTNGRNCSSRRTYGGLPRIRRVDRPQPASRPVPPAPEQRPGIPAGDARVGSCSRPFSIVAVAVALAARLWNWVGFRRAHSITDDAFVEAHIINIAPQMVSGRIVRFLVEENDRVEPGQVLAEIDPTPYRDKVDAGPRQARGGPGGRGPPEGRARAGPQGGADPGRARRGERWPRRRSTGARPSEALTLTRDGVEKDIEEARAGVKAARASLTLAEPGIWPLLAADPAGGQHPGTPAAGDAVARRGPGSGRAGRGQAGEGAGRPDAGRHRPPLARIGPDGHREGRPRASTSRRSATTRSTSSSC